MSPFIADTFCRAGAVHRNITVSSAVRSSHAGPHHLAFLWCAWCDAIVHERSGFGSAWQFVQSGRLRRGSTPALSRYLKEMRNMQARIFKGPGRVFAVTTDPAGANLPHKYPPWTAFKTIELQKDVPIPGVDVNDCLRDLETHGIHVTDAHVRITEDAIR